MTRKLQETFSDNNTKRIVIKASILIGNAVKFHFFAINNKFDDSLIDFLFINCKGVKTE